MQHELKRTQHETFVHGIHLLTHSLTFDRWSIEHKEHNSGDFVVSSICESTEQDSNWMLVIFDYDQKSLVRKPAASSFSREFCSKLWFSSLIFTDRLGYSGDRGLPPLRTRTWNYPLWIVQLSVRHSDASENFASSLLNLKFSPSEFSKCSELQVREKSYRFSLGIVDTPLVLLNPRRTESL